MQDVVHLRHSSWHEHTEMTRVVHPGHDTGGAASVRFPTMHEEASFPSALFTCVSTSKGIAVPTLSYRPQLSNVSAMANRTHPLPSLHGPPRVTSFPQLPQLHFPTFA